MKKTALNIASKTLFKTMVMKNAKSGDSLKFITDYPISKQQQWAKATPAYAKGITAQDILIKEIEKELIPLKAATLFKEKVNNWQGEDMPLGKTWLKDIIRDLDEREKVIANIMFLSAFAAYIAKSL